MKFILCLEKKNAGSSSRARLIENAIAFSRNSTLQCLAMADQDTIAGTHDQVTGRLARRGLLYGFKDYELIS